jgi:hypothetical protein
MTYLIQEGVPGWFEEPSEHAFMELRYNPSEPFLVAADFGHNNVWHFSRDLLFDGLNHRAGLGDVAIWPHVRHIENTPWASHHVVIRLQPPEEASTDITFLRSPIEQFLQRTERIVPRGQESRHMNFDDVIFYLSQY